MFKCPKCQSSEIEITKREVTEYHDASKSTHWAPCGDFLELTDETVDGSYHTDYLSVNCLDCDREVELINDGCVVDGLTGGEMELLDNILEEFDS